jgi:hypothetical protein
MKLRYAVMLATVALTGLSYAMPVRAQPRPLPQKQLSRSVPSGARLSPTARAAHVVYGTLSSVRGAALVLRTRRGVSQRVDAAGALASGSFSAPLFAGKIVAVTGYFDAARVLHAQSVTRLTRLDPSTAADR